MQTLVQIDEDIQATEATLRDLEAAQRALAAEESAKNRKEAAAQAAREDRASQALFDQLATDAAALQDALKVYAAKYAAFQATLFACRSKVVQNGRIRQDTVLLGHSLDVASELARQASLAGLEPQLMPPGAERLALVCGDPGGVASLHEKYRSIAASVLPQKATA
jgi:hypothetical protein